MFNRRKLGSPFFCLAGMGWRAKKNPSQDFIKYLSPFSPSKHLIFWDFCIFFGKSIDKKVRIVYPVIVSCIYK